MKLIHYILPFQASGFEFLSSLRREIENENLRKIRNRFTNLIPDYLTLVTESTGILVLLIFVFYASRMLASFRKGMLERGWKFVTTGAILLVAAQIPIVLGSVSTGVLASILVNIANFGRFGAILLLTLGFRDQYQIWRVDGKVNTQFAESADSIADVQNLSSA